MAPPAWITQLARDGRVRRNQVTNDHDLHQLVVLGLAMEHMQGKRRQVLARDLAALQEWVMRVYPPPAEATHAGLRAANIARTRRSKAGTSTHSVQPLLMRWFGPERDAPYAELTRRLGMVGLTTDRIGELAMPARWTLVSVENWESFLTADYEGSAETVVVVYAGGQIASAILQALACMEPAPLHAIHFGDYDWTGLAIYRRLRTAMPMMQLYVPDDIETLFVQFADTALLAGQVPVMANGDDPPQVHRLIDLIARYNAGLEQEIVSPPRLPWYC